MSIHTLSTEKIRAWIRPFVWGLGITLMIGIAGCRSPKVTAINPAGYPNTPQDKRHEALSIYLAWDGGSGETWKYAFSADGVIEQTGKPSQPEQEGIIMADDELPGGLTMWFRGLSPGDVVVVFTTKDNRGKTVAIHQYAVRVYDDLRLSLLHEEFKNFRK